MNGWTGREMLAVAASRLIRADDVAVVGLGLPQMAALLAMRTHAPGVSLLLEIGVFEPDVREEAMGIADPAMWEGSRAFGGMLDVLGYMVAGGRVTVGILGALQVDPDGGINSSMVRDEEGRPRRFLGSGGANDIASFAQRTIIVMRHEGRKFKPALDFLTSPGHRVRGRARSEVGLPGWGTSHIVTDRAVIEVTDAGPLLRSVHPGEDVDAVLAQTGIVLQVPDRGPEIGEPPDPGALRVLREDLDPHGWYTG